MVCGCGARLGNAFRSDRRARDEKDDERQRKGDLLHESGPHGDGRHRARRGVFHAQSAAAALRGDARLDRRRPDADRHRRGLPHRRSDEKIVFSLQFSDLENTLKTKR